MKMLIPLVIFVGLITGALLGYANGKDSNKRALVVFSYTLCGLVGGVIVAGFIRDVSHE